MAIPNLAATTNSYGVTKVRGLTNSWYTLTGSADNNMASYGTIPGDYSAKIHTLMIANYDGSNACDVSVRLYNSATNGYFNIASTISVPADSNLVVISHDTAIWLDEGDSLECWASTSSDLNAVCSFTLFAD